MCKIMGRKVLASRTFHTSTYLIPAQANASSAQNSSSVHWCRRRVRFNELPEKVPKVPEKVWEVLVHSQVRFNRVPEKVLEKVPGSLGAKPSQVQQGSGEGSGEESGEGLGGFGAEPDQVSRGRAAGPNFHCPLRAAGIVSDFQNLPYDT